MDKDTYYVSVQAGTIMQTQGEAAYELEIRATEEDVRKLRLIFESMNKIDFASHFRAMLPGIPYHFDSENDVYDEELRNVYGLLYELGTEETQKHIAGMGILS